MGFDLGNLFGGSGGGLLGQAGNFLGGGGTMGIVGGIGSMLGTQSNTPGYQVDPNAYQYGGHAGGADAAQKAYEQEGQDLQSREGAQINQDASQLNEEQIKGLMGQEQGLAGHFQDVLSGKAPSLAEAQAKAAADQNIAAQMAAAHSMGGPGAALAGRTAAMTGAQALQGAAEQSVQGRLAEEQAAAGNLGQLYGQIGQQGQGLMSTNAQLEGEQAGFQQQQQALNNQALMGMYGMGQQAQLAQLTAQGQGQQAGLESTGQQMGQSEANASNNLQLTKSIAGGIGGAATPAPAAGDLHFVDPRPHGPTWTVREEPHFLAVRRPSGEIEELATKPLSEAHRLEMQSTPHGAGPMHGKNVSQPGVHGGIYNDAPVGRPGDLGLEGMSPDLGEQGMVNLENADATSGNVAGLAASPGYDQGWDTPQGNAMAATTGQIGTSGAGGGKLAQASGPTSNDRLRGFGQGFQDPDSTLGPKPGRPGMPGYHAAKYAYDLSLGSPGVQSPRENRHPGGVNRMGMPSTQLQVPANGGYRPMIAHDMTLDSSFGGGEGQAYLDHDAYDLRARQYAAMRARFPPVQYPPAPPYHQVAHDLYFHDMPMGGGPPSLAQAYAQRPMPAPPMNAMGGQLPMQPPPRPPPQMQPQMMAPRPAPQMRPTPQMMNAGAQQLQNRAMMLRGGMGR
ncbi:MAG TPA: hypothetical protein VF213_11995 [Dongiaceae bacterium]